LKLILFDVDGTLVDSQNIIVAAQRMAFAAHGLEPPSRELSLSIVGLSLVEAFTVLVGSKGPVVELAEAYKEAFAVLRQDPAHAEPLFPGAGACLEQLSRRQDVLLGIATGKSRRGVAHLLERHDWHKVFATIQTADDAPSKPHPAMILQAMDELGVAPQDTAMIGDSSYDMAMARAAGVEAIGVSWGFQPVAALTEAGARHIIHSYGELGPILNEFLDRPSHPAA
jgi:phosphoglycolate phosphatase